MAGGFRASRRRLLTSLAGAALAPATVAASRGRFTTDAALLSNGLFARYPYFDAASRQRFRARFSAMAARIAASTDAVAFLSQVEELLASLQDDHVSVVERAPASMRRIPAETDLWASWFDGYARVDAVRIGSDADSAGIAPGRSVVRVNGISIPRAVRNWAGGHTDDRTRDWAVRHLLAGPRSGPFTIDLVEGDGTQRVELVRRAAEDETPNAMVWRRLGEQRDLAYLRLRDGLADPGLVDEIDLLLARLAGVRAILLDLRDLNDPGDPAVTAAVLARFAPARLPWQVRESKLGEGTSRITDYVQPQGVRSRLPVVALVDRWTAGEGEALAAGLWACGARLVGTRMAGLRGVTGEIHLPESGITVRFPVERALLPDGRARETLRPHVAVDPAAPSGGPGDPILYQALKSAG